MPTTRSRAADAPPPAPVAAPAAPQTAAAARRRRRPPPPEAAAPAPPPRWADLPPEALELIFSQANDLEALCRAACVCRSWRAAAAARPALWEDVHVAAGTRYGEDGQGAEWATRKFVAQLRWCAARGGAIKSLHVFAAGASEEDLLGGFHDDEAAGRAQPGALVEALEACGTALRALEIGDRDDQLGFYSPPVDAVWAGALRGLPSLRLDLPYFADAWPLLAQLTALTALTARAPTQTVHGERPELPYRRSTPLPPALRELSLQTYYTADGPGWVLPAALSALTGLTRLDLRADERYSGGDAPFWARNWARVTRLRRLRRLELTAERGPTASPTLPSLDGIAAMTRLSCLDLRRVMRAEAPEDGDSDPDFDPDYPAVCALDLSELARLPRLACLLAPALPALPAELAAASTLRDLTLLGETPLRPGRYLARLVRLALEVHPDSNLEALAAAGALEDLCLHGGTDADLTDALQSRIPALPLPRLRRCGVPRQLASAAAAALRQKWPALEIYTDVYCDTRV